MHVDVHGVGRHVDEQVRFGTALAGGRGRVRVDHGVGNRPVLHDAPVDEILLGRACRPLLGQRRDIPANAQAPRFLVDANQIRALSVQLIEALVEAGVGGTVAGAALGLSTAAFVACILSAVIIGVFGHLMPARTVKGARALEGALGFEEFLDRVEGDRFNRVVRTPEMFERFLPFAMALGVERGWARAFEGIYTSQPDWYVGNYHGAFGPRMFAASLADLSSDAGSAMSSAPRSSGGSGAGGGGFSGGGFGGGGGGGF